MASLNLYSQTAYDCLFHVANLQYDWNAYNYNSCVITNGSTTNGSTTDPSGTWYAVVNPGATGGKYIDDIVSGLDPETSYTLKAYIMTTDMRWWYAGSDTIKTTPEVLPDEPYHDYTNLVGTNSAYIRFIKAFDTIYTEVKWNISGSDPDYWATYDQRTTSSTNITISNLPYGSDVYFWIRSRNSSGVTSGWVWAGMVTTSSRPNNWEWSYNIVSGGVLYNTYVEGSTIYAYPMTAAEYNFFTNRINEFRDYRGLSTYSFTQAQSGVNLTKTQLKNMINECVTAINQIGFSIPAVGSELKASTFTQMRDSLNSIV